MKGRKYYKSMSPVIVSVGVLLVPVFFDQSLVFLRQLVLWHHEVLVVNVVVHFAGVLSPFSPLTPNFSPERGLRVTVQFTSMIDAFRRRNPVLNLGQVPQRYRVLRVLHLTERKTQIQSNPYKMFAADLQPSWPSRPKTNITLLFYFLKLYNFGLNEIFVGSTSSE